MNLDQQLCELVQITSSFASWFNTSSLVSLTLSCNSSVFLNDPLEDFDYNDPRCNPLLRSAAARTLATPLHTSPQAVMDISEMMYTYLSKIKFGESQNSISSESLDVAPKTLDNVEENNTWQIVPISASEGTPRKIKECDASVITAQQYASRNSMLTPLVVAWSPMLRTSGNRVSIPHNSSSCCSILATGLKCGTISFWRIDAPESYSICSPELPCKASNVGLLKAHDAFITSICWASYGSEISDPQLLLATGSSNGRVKIWQVITEELLKSSETIHASFSLLREVITIDSAPVSVLSFTIPRHTPLNLLLAIGKGSGSFEVWTMNMPNHEFEIVGCYSAHDHIVTGLAWAFDGRCLYTCSQVPYVYDSCYGLAVSHGNLAIAVNDEVNEIREHQDSERSSIAIEEHANAWKELQLCCENELRKRLVGLSFSSILTLLSDAPTVGCWHPDERPQLEQWLSLHEKIVEDDLKLLAREVDKVKKRRETFEYEEHCSFCSAIVPFDSTEYAICSGVNNEDGVDQTHKLRRCSASMQLCSTKYSWFCMCCQRWVSKLAPLILFMMPGYPSNFKSFFQSSAFKKSFSPCCPLCGILLQRLQPEYLLSPSPV
ncbi:hypothetical protein F511_32321 [Dorcoceras hygrometricum]|uniref:Transcription factor IIIC 90kDa subunit N-terminal domain-containing protein n=1 Tax=Dorcoceras hygrometricum TaxID=472368 RepID=A0A2Z7D0L7_9LAMI|nr:hypothetical protein F511_32321 [Dorcoceras hygrometricum]